MFYLETQKKIEDSPDGARQVCVCVRVCVKLFMAAAVGDPGRAANSNSVITAKDHTLSSKEEEVMMSTH